ncbi:MAG: J domain-containing protein [Acidimicrobiales bacterium]|nr:J domain-containing protein [Acidimicrobiales bacterium]
MEDPKNEVANPSLYEQLGVPISSTQESLQRAYRRLALVHHPDRKSGDSLLMRQINDAWFVLSDPGRRAEYDRTLKHASFLRPKQPRFSSSQKLSRKAAWFAGIRLQTLRLGGEAARSATQALSNRHQLPRSTYEELAPPIIQTLGQDIEQRVQLSRKAGAAPLDLGLASALLGLNAYCAPFLRRSLEGGVSEEDVLRAQLIDRMWDNLAHGINRDIEIKLGGNPRALRSLTGRRI